MSDSSTLAATVVGYTVRPENAEALREAVQRHLVPAARDVPGYRGFLLLDQGDGKRLAVVLFDSSEQRRLAQEKISAAARDGGVYALMADRGGGGPADAIIVDGLA